MERDIGKARGFLYMCSPFILRLFPAMLYCILIIVTDACHLLQSGYQFKGLLAVSRSNPSAGRVLRSEVHGENNIDVDVPPYPILLYREILNPFYIFQAFAIILWVFEQYYQYSAVLFAMTIVAAGLSLYETRRNLLRLRDMVHMKGQVEMIFRQGSEESIRVRMGLGERCYIDRDRVRLNRQMDG